MRIPAGGFMHVVYTPDRDQGGEVTGWIASIADVTERKAAEEALRQSEERYRLLFEGNPHSMWVFDRETLGFLAVNEAAIQQYGYSRDEFLRLTLKDIRPPEHVAAMLDYYDRRGSKVPAGVVDRAGVWTHRRKDGTVFEVEITGCPISFQDRDAALVMGVDVTQRRRAEAASQAAKQQLEMVTDSMSAPVTRCSRDLRYVWVNKSYAQWVGRQPEEIVGHAIIDVLGHEAFERLSPHFQQVLGGERVHYEEEVNFRGLGPRWINAVYTPTFDAAGVVDGWVAVVIDTTQHKRLEEALKEADRRKDEFLAILAHELRNPLAPVRNAVQVLRLKGPPTPELEWARDVIDRQIQQMTRLIDDLMDVSRITRGRLELRKERVELARVLQGAVETSRPLLDGLEHKLTVALPSDPVYLDADITRLAQVFSNLLNNAAKYSERGSRITLAAERRGSEVVVSVRDAGIGIPKEMLPRIFDMFTQVDRSLERAQSGLGIGLTIVKRLVEMHGGSVEARSDGPGKGSEFIVRLPIPILDAPRGSHPATGEGTAVTLARRRILIADDNKDAATSLSMMLNALGYETRAAYDGPEALDAAAEFHPDVALLDIGMPNMNGCEVARRLQAQPWGKEIVLIAVTGWGQPEDRQRTFDAGFHHHLVKPVAPAELAKLLASIGTEVALSG